MKTRILSLLLCVLMLVSMVPVSVSAAENDVAMLNNVKYATLAEAIAKVSDGDIIYLLNECTENVTIKQTKDTSFTIDGLNETYTGTITIDGNKRSTGAETLTIKNIEFLAVTDSQSFISAKNNTYAHNITVDGCTFTGTNARKAYGLSLRHAYNITVKNTTGSKLLDLAYSAKAVTGFTAENVTVTDSVNGFYLSYVINASFKNLNLDVTNNGVYVNNYNSSSANFENCTITAPIPVCLQQTNTTNKFDLTFNGINTFNGKSENGEWLTVTGTDAMFTVNVNDSGLDMTKTSGLVANIGNIYYNICPGHNYQNGICQVCKQPCPHENVENDVCNDCGMNRKAQTVKIQIYRNGDNTKPYKTFDLPGYRTNDVIEINKLNINDYYPGNGNGFTFDGWYKDGWWKLGDTHTVNGWTNILCMVTDYETLSVKAVINGDKDKAEIVTTTTALHGTKLIDALNAITVDKKTGYTLDKWYNWDWYGNKIADNATVNGWTNVYVTYAPNQYTITYDYGFGNRKESATAIYDSEVAIKSPNPKYKKSGYTFIGWSFDGQTFNANEKITYQYAKNITLTAKWSANDGSLAFVPNGGVGEVFTVAATSGKL